jgi:drug/metabolite transporter (DMT)-like permease
MGEFFSVLCTVFWAIAIILFKKCGTYYSAKNLNLFKNIIGSVLFIISMIVLGENFIPKGVKLVDVFVLGLSGIIGMSLADTILFISLKKLGATLIGVVEALYAPFVVFISSVFFYEEITLKIILGTILVFLGIIVSSIDFKQTTTNISRKDLFIGLFWGVIAFLGMALGVVIMKKPFLTEYSVLDTYSSMWTTTVRITIATLIMLPFSLIKRTGKSRSEFFAMFRPNPNWRILVPGSVLGAYLSMFTWIVGIKYLAKVSVASILNQTTIVWVAILAVIFLKEKFTLNKVLSVVLALAGVVVVVI